MRVPFVSPRAERRVRRSRRRDVQRALSEGRVEDALAEAWDLAEGCDPNTQMQAWIELGDLFETLGRNRQAGFVRLAIGDLDRVASLLGDGPDVRAWCAARAGAHLDAADRHRELGRPVHVAIALERAGAHEAAAQQWISVAQGASIAHDPYLSGLAWFCAGCSQSESHGIQAARGSFANAERRLLAAADVAFAADRTDVFHDAHSVIAEIALREQAPFRFAEAAARCAEALERDGHLRGALSRRVAIGRFLVDPIASAGVFEETAGWCAKLGMPFERACRCEAAAAWEAAAEAALADARLPEAEAAYVCAVENFLLGDCAEDARECVVVLARIASDPLERLRYRAIASARVEGAAGAGAEILPQSAYPFFDVARADLVENELGGDFFAVLVAGVAESSAGWPIRERMLRSLLRALDVPAGHEEQLPAIIRGLGCQVSILPLEKLSRDPRPSVRAAVARTLGKLPYHRTTRLLLGAVFDADESVRGAAVEAIREVRHAPVLRALARLDLDAAEPALRQAVRDALDQPAFPPSW